MIITCEQCNARYLLASLLLGESGRKVRCGVCGHTWFQEAGEEILTREAADNITFADMMGENMDPIPEGVRPIPEGSAMPALRQGRKFPVRKEDIEGVFTALLVFVLVTAILGGLLFAFRENVMRVWPSSALLYEVAGVKLLVPGEGLVFDRVRAVAVPDQNGVYTLTITGNIINLRQEEITLPKIEASLESESGPLSWTITPDTKKIAGEETMPFTATYNDLPDNAGEVTIRFVLRY